DQEPGRSSFIQRPPPAGIDYWSRAQKARFSVGLVPQSPAREFSQRLQKPRLEWHYHAALRPLVSWLTPPTMHSQSYAARASERCPLKTRLAAMLSLIL